MEGKEFTISLQATPEGLACLTCFGSLRRGIASGTFDRHGGGKLAGLSIRAFIQTIAGGVVGKWKCGGSGSAGGGRGESY
jgi:hypothetical protein